MQDQDATRDQIEELFQTWNAALQTRDPGTVAALYAQDAILLPTLSNEMRQTPEAIEAYFTEFVKLHPIATIIAQNIRIFGQIAMNSGLYSFAIINNGEIGNVIARFTFVYRQDSDGWKIIEHHSSMMPES